MSQSIGTSTSTTATLYTFQRKIGRASSGKIIVFALVDGVVKYKTSSDTGVTWDGAWVTAFSLGTISSFSIYQDGDDILLVVDTLFSTRRIYFNKLTYSSGTDSWSVGSNVIIDAAVTRQYPTITTRSNGDLWVTGDNGSGVAASYYSTNGGVNWSAGGTFGTSINALCVIPKGSNIWCVTQRSGKFTVYEFTTSWGAGSDVVASGQTNTQGMGVLRIDDSNIFVAGGTSSGIKVFKYNGTVWDGGTLLSDNSSDGSATLTAVGGNPVLVWTDFDGANRDTSYRQYTGASWDTQVDLTSDATQDWYPSAIDSDAGLLIVEWRRGDGSPYNIQVEVLDLVVSVSTGSASGIEINSAILNGTLVSLGGNSSVDVYFEWGLDTSYGNATSPQTLTAAGDFFDSISGLMAAGTYHFRAVADLGGGITFYGADAVFTTANPLLSWYAIYRTTLSGSLDWLVKTKPKFCPNIIPYQFVFSTPTVDTEKFPVSLSGCLHSASVYLENTGSTGSTAVEVYISSVLKHTFTIPASGLEYSTVSYFDMSELIYPKDYLEIRVTSVSTGAENLKVILNQMSFPFKVEVLFTANEKDAVVFTGVNRDVLFGNAEKWKVYFNQPVLSVNCVTENINGEEITLTAAIVDGLFYNNCLEITPYTEYSLNRVKMRVEDIRNEFHYLEITPPTYNTLGIFPRYFFGTVLEVNPLIPIGTYRYSFDAITWSEFTTLEDEKVNIDFSGRSEGDTVVYLEYKNDNQVISEEVTVFYADSQIDCQVYHSGKSATLTYTDVVPLDRVEVYYDGVLSGTTFPTVRNGFDTVTTNATNKTITVSEGDVYFGGERYGFSETTFNLDYESILVDGVGRKVILFGFNTNTLDFELKEQPVMLETSAEVPAAFIVLARIDYLMYFNAVGSEDVSVTFGQLVQEIISSDITLKLDIDKDIIIRVYDLAQRTRDFTMDFVQQVYIIDNGLTVICDGVPIEQGEIHTEETLNFTVDEEEW